MNEYKIGIYYEHPRWFQPLFEELERRGVPHVRVHAPEQFFDPAHPENIGLVFNRMSPSAYRRGTASGCWIAISLGGEAERRW